MGGSDRLNSILASTPLVEEMETYGDNPNDSADNPIPQGRNGVTKHFVTQAFNCSVPGFQQPAEQCLSGNRFDFINTTVEQGTVQYTWKFGDGSESTSKNPGKTYSAAGLYDVKLIVSDGAGCLDSVTRQVRVKPTPAAGFQVDLAGQCLRSNQFRFTSAPQPVGLTVSRLWRFGDGSVSTGSNPSYSYGTSGARTVRLTVTSSEGCADSSERSLLVYAMPVARFTVNDSVQCLNRNEFQFRDASLSGAAISWLFEDGSVNAGQTATRRYGAAGGYDVRLTVVSSEGCRDSLTRRMRVLAVPKAAFDVDDADQCLRGNLFSFRNLSQPNATIVRYEWAFGDGSSSLLSNPTHAYLSGGLRDVMLRAVSSEGCRDSVNRTVDVLTHPVAVFDDPADQCLRGNRFRFTSRSTASAGSLTETRWEFGDGGAAMGPASERSYLQAGTYAVRLLIQADNGCRDTLVHAVTAHPNPSVAAVAPPAPQCLSGNLFTFRAGSTILSGSVVSHVWDFGDGTGGNGRDVSHSYVGHGQFPARVWALSDKGCGDTAFFSVDVRPDPKAVFMAEGSGSICEGTSVQLRSGAESPGRQHQWLLDGNPIVGATDSFFTARQAGAYRLRVTLGICQRTSAPFSVIVNPMPTVLADVPVARCLTGNLFSFQSRSTVRTGTLAHDWDLGDGSRAQGAIVTHGYGSSGQYWVRLMVTTDKGCTDSSSLTAVVHAEPEVIVTPGPDREICDGDSLLLVSGSLPGSGIIRGQRWILDGQYLPGAVDGSLMVRQAGLYRLEVENSNGCRKTGGDMRLIVNPLPSGSLSQPSLPVICEGSALLLRASGADSYLWLLNGTPVPGASGSQLSVTQPGRYTVVAISAKGCRNPIPGSVTAVLQRRPTPSIIASDRCIGLPLTFGNASDTVGAGPLTWQWDFGDGSSSSAFAPTHTYRRIGMMDVTLRVQSPNCPAHGSALTRRLTVDSPRSPLRYPTLNALRNSPLPLEARGFGVSYRWSPAAGLNRLDTLKPIFQSDKEQDYQIRIETSTGCVTIDSLMVFMFQKSDVFVPRAFSPNGDGHNDRLEVFLAGITEVKFFRIYNRWGQLVHETRSPIKPWDGSSKGQAQPSDTYVWVVEAVPESGGRVVKRGQVVLIR
jgi:gliding motility-associated-like protein